MSRVAVVGAGPAGIAAAVCAAEGGQQVTLIDDNPREGGQIWRGETAGEWFERLKGVRVARLQRARVIAAGHDTLRVELPDRALTLRYDKLILATGARERFLPYPGWTLPRALGAGGMQAFVKSGLDVRGARVVVGGTGPLLLAVAALLRKRGAKVEAIIEQAPLGRVIRFALGLPASKLAQAVSLKASLLGVPHLHDRWITGFTGSSVRLNSGRTIECDYAAVGYGLVPNTELAEMIGPRENVWQAGECTGIGGVEKSLLEGAQAGHLAAGNKEGAAALQPEIGAAREFAVRLEEAFALRPELKTLATLETIVCRCENVAAGALEDMRSWREAKLYTRCGMGPCQGRVCGPAVEFLRGWKPDSVRPPLLPVRVETMIGGRE